MEYLTIIGGFVIAGIMGHGVFDLLDHRQEKSPAREYSLKARLAGPIVIIGAMWMFGAGIAGLTRATCAEETKSAECKECRTIRNLWSTDKASAIRYLQLVSW